MDRDFTQPGGHDGGPAFVDGLASLYITVAIVWTFALGLGMAYLYAHRREPCVRIRNLPLVVGAVLGLHVYWVLCMLAYPMNGTYPCVTEYWIMSIYLPLGIALFQASNMQLLSIACLQERMLSAPETSTLKVQRPARTFRSYWRRFNDLSLLKRTEAAIGVGMIVQLIISLAIFLASRKFVPFGIVGDSVNAADCRRGAEWVPSIVWQLSWAWFFAPYILWRIRHIHDIHQWRRQTIICVIAGLPGSPLWLAALYSPSSAWQSINTYWLPPLWFSPGIMVMQGATVFAPCITLYQALKNQRYIAAALREWEERHRGGDKAASASDTTDTGGSSTRTVATRGSRRHELYSRAALERYLAGEAAGLLDFAVHREFTGENVNFLLCVREWRAAWTAVRAAQPDYDWTRDPRGHRRALFAVGVQIFVDLVEVASAAFPINVAAPVLTGLRAAFADGARALDRAPPPATVNVAAPFLHDCPPAPLALGDATLELVPPRDATRSGSPADAPRPWRQDSCRGMHRGIMRARPPLPAAVAVPRDFDADVFDRAEASVQAMVLQTTWPRFVEACLLPAAEAAEAAGAGAGDVERGRGRARFGTKRGAQVRVASA